MLWMAVDRKQDRSLIRQVYDHIRLNIVRGVLRAGERLPSTRRLASELRISRIVVVEAYEQLQAEGYIESRPGAGTYVASGAYLEEELKTLPPGAQMMNITPGEGNGLIDFRPGLPALTHFPRRLWGQLAARVCAEAPASIFGYSGAEGCAELRTALARYLAKTRGVRCHPDQVMITTGATQAFVLLARLLLSSEDEVIIEDPVTYEVPLILTATGASLHPLPVDEQGLRTDLLSSSRHAGLVYVTPSHQFPLGGMLPIQRRIRLIQFARAAGCSIIEDDYDSEFRYDGTPISALQELEPERVIYVGTFSKCLSPALRLGYAILPPALIEPCRRLKRLSDLHSPILDQFVLARFLEEGHLQRHIMNMRKLYRRRREALLRALATYLPGQISASGAATGLHLVVECPGSAFTEETLAALENAGVRLYPVEEHAIRKGAHGSKAILGYGNLSEEEIEEGVKRIASVLEKEKQFMSKNKSRSATT